MQVCLLSATRKGDRPQFSGESWLFPNPSQQCSLDSSLTKQQNKTCSDLACLSALVARSCGFARGRSGREGAGHLLCAREKGPGEESATGCPGGEVPRAGRLTVTLPWITPLCSIYTSTPSSSFLQLDVI